MKPLLPIALILLFSTQAFASIFDLSANHTVGPLGTRAQNALYLLFLTDTIERGASSLKQNDLSISVETTVSNGMEGTSPQNWDQVKHYQSSNFVLDLESWRHVVKLNYGIFDKYSVGLEIPFLTLTGGFLDPTVQGYHHAFGFPNGGREYVPDNSFSYEVSRDGGVVYKPSKTNFGLSDIIVSNKVQFLEETTFAPALSAKASLKLPTGSSQNATGSGGIGFAASLFVEKSISRFHSYTLLGLSLNDGLKELRPILNVAQFTFGQAFELNIFEYLSLVAQVTGNTSMFHDVTDPDFKNVMAELSIGLAGDVPLTGGVKKIHYEFAFTEDPFGAGPAVDFAILFKIGVVL
jgi:hypothetical protein